MQLRRRARKRTSLPDREERRVDEQLEHEGRPEPTDHGGGYTLHDVGTRSAAPEERQEARVIGPLALRGVFAPDPAEKCDNKRRRSLSLPPAAETLRASSIQSSALRTEEEISSAASKRRLSSSEADPIQRPSFGPFSPYGLLPPPSLRTGDTGLCRGSRYPEADESDSRRATIRRSFAARRAILPPFPSRKPSPAGPTRGMSRLIGGQGGWLSVAGGPSCNIRTDGDRVAS